MRRVYTQKPRSSKVREQALEQYRRTRAQILRDHAGLLDELCGRITARAADREGGPPLFRVNRRKNLQTVLKCLENNPFSKDFRKKIEALLSESGP